MDWQNSHRIANLELLATDHTMHTQMYTHKDLRKMKEAMCVCVCVCARVCVCVPACL